MITAASAVTTVDPATTPEVVTTPAAPAFDATDQKTWSGAQRDHWNKTGTQPTKADSATASDTEKKDTTQPDSSTGKDKTSADTASDSATDKTQKPNLKTKEDTDRRFREILEENKSLQRRLESLERGKGSDTRDTKQASQPAPEAYRRLDEKEFFKANPKASYEDYVEAAIQHGAKHVAEKAAADAVQKFQTDQQQRAAQQELNARVEEAKKRYPDFEERIQPAVQAIADDPQIPHAVKALINDSPVFTDLVYVLADPKALADLIATAKTNPTAALRKITLTEQLVMAELAKVKDGAQGSDKTAAGDGSSGDGTKRDASGKFVSSENKDDAASETKPRAPKPPSEVGGRGTASEDALASAAKAGNFRAFEAEQNRRLRASAKA